MIYLLIAVVLWAVIGWVVILAALRHAVGPLTMADIVVALFAGTVLGPLCIPACEPLFKEKKQ